MHKYYDKSRAYYDKFKDEILAYNKEYYSKNKDLYKSHRRKNNLKRFGLTVEKFEEMAVSQGGRCAICLNSPAARGRWGVFYVDHDHETGKVRGLLCAKCNLALGQFEDNKDYLSMAIDYLVKHER